MHEDNMFLAHQRVHEARKQAHEAREARLSRRGRGHRSLLERLRVGH